MTALSRILEETAAARRRAAREVRRATAEKYTRKPRALRYWMFDKPGRAVVFHAGHRPDDPAVTRRLCHALYADYTTARNLPGHYQGRNMRRDELRTLFTCECALYARQKARRVEAAE